MDQKWLVRLRKIRKTKMAFICKRNHASLHRNNTVAYLAGATMVLQEEEKKKSQSGLKSIFKCMSFPFTTLIKQPRHNLGQLNVLIYTSIICQGVYFTAEPQNALFRVWSPFSVAFLAGVCVCVCTRVYNQSSLCNDKKHGPTTHSGINHVMIPHPRLQLALSLCSSFPV